MPVMIFASREKCWLMSGIRKDSFYFDCRLPMFNVGVTALFRFHKQKCEAIGLTCYSRVAYFQV